MNTELTIDSSGRLVLPKAVRQALGLKPGDSLKVETEEDRVILSPVRDRAGLQKEHGVWVYRSGTSTDVSVVELIEQQRKRRAEEVMGNP
jgi:AbrB family looped-hinge helix DNA binding protein